VFLIRNWGQPNQFAYRVIFGVPGIAICKYIHLANVCGNWDLSLVESKSYFNPGTELGTLQAQIAS
jgi:hypothetical protein